MTDTNKPAWVEALDEARDALRSTSGLDDAALIDAKTRSAYAWIAVSEQLKT